MRRERDVIQERDDELVAELFRKHRDQLARHLVRLLRSAALAQEALQDTYEKFCALDVRTIENPSAYLFQVGTRLAIDQMRRREIEAKDVLRRVPLEDDSKKVAGPEARAILDESIDHLAEQISLLSSGQREVIVMRYLHGMEPADIIDRLGISESAYRQRVVAAKHELRERLRAIGVDPDAL